MPRYRNRRLQPSISSFRSYFAVALIEPRRNRPFADRRATIVGDRHITSQGKRVIRHRAKRQRALPPVDRSPGEIAGTGFEVVIVTGSLRRQCGAGRSNGGAGTVNGDRDGTPGKVRHAPAMYGVLRSEAVGAGCVEVAGLTAGFNGRAITTTGTARRT